MKQMSDVSMRAIDAKSISDLRSARGVVNSCGLATLQSDPASLAAEMTGVGVHEAIQIEVWPPRPRQEVVAALGGFILEMSASKEAVWGMNPIVGYVSGYFVTRKAKKIDPRDGILKARIRSTLLLLPNTSEATSHKWFNSLYWPMLTRNIDGNSYYRQRVGIELEVVKNSTAIAAELENAFAEPNELLAIGSFGRFGIDEYWIKPKYARRVSART